jgi:hypothetical protein
VRGLIALVPVYPLLTLSVSGLVEVQVLRCLP